MDIVDRPDSNLRDAWSSKPKSSRQVKTSLPPEKLLVFDVKEGWEPLCRFLEVPVPDKPFPRLNDTEAFRERVRQMQASQAPTPTHA